MIGARLALAALGAAGVLGALFFVGLWWTVRRALATANPTPWFAASLLLRTGLVLAGFYLICAAAWQGVALCLLGFLGARGAIIRLTRVAIDSRNAS